MIYLFILILNTNSKQLFLDALYPDYDATEPRADKSFPQVIQILRSEENIQMITTSYNSYKGVEGFKEFWAKREGDYSLPHTDLLRRWFIGELTHSEVELLRQADHEGRSLYHFISLMDVLSDDLSEHVLNLTDLALSGSSMAQFAMGMLYSSGLYVQADLPRGLLFIKQASDGGNMLAAMDLASRYMHGISLPRNCHEANVRLRVIAKLVVANMSSWETRIGEFPRLSKDRHVHISWDSSQSVYINYLSLFFPKHSQTQLELARFYLGDSAYNVDSLRQAFDIFTDAHSHGSEEAAAYLGHFYLEGTPFLERDYPRAMQLFEVGEALNMSDALTGLGIIHLYGLGVEQNYSLAKHYFNLSSTRYLENDSTMKDGNVYLHAGIMKLFGIGYEESDNKNIRDIFSLGASMRNLPSVFFLAEQHAVGMGMFESCAISSELNELVVVNGMWRYLAMKAFRLWKAGEVQRAYNYYTLLVEIGVRGALENAVYILYQELKGGGRLNVSGEHARGRLVQLLNRLTKQNDKEAHKILANMYYHGIGIDVDMSAAFNHYMAVAERDDEAKFNVGYMYEHGLGVAKDLHSAERFYSNAGQLFETWMSTRLAIYKMKLVYWISSLETFSNIGVTMVLIALSGVVFGANWVRG